MVQTVAGDPSVAGDVIDDNFGNSDGGPGVASFYSPLDVAVARTTDGADAVYVADYANHRIRRILVMPGQEGTRLSHVLVVLPPVF